MLLIRHGGAVPPSPLGGKAFFWHVCAGGSFSAGIKTFRNPQIKGMKKVKNDPLGKAREERETCFPEGRAEDLRP